MNVLFLSRLQFAVATYFHFLFVPLTLGLSVLVAWMETTFVRTGDETWRRMAKFWGKLFLINFAIGVVTGITLEFQFGTNWSRYSEYVGDVFGSLLAVEATLAFFLESTFIAVWFFGWNKLSPKAHAVTIWLVALASNVSAFWILVANAFMQHPVGFVIRNGRAELTDFFAVITQKFALLEVVHVVGGAYTVAGFFVMGISAWHLLRRNQVDFFSKSFRVGATFALLFAVWELALGHANAEILGQTQPAKLAAMESQWETGTRVPVHLLEWPDPQNERNAIEGLPVPGLLSLLANYDVDSKVVGLKDIPVDERPPVLLPFLSFRAMVGLGFLLIALAVLAFRVRKAPADAPAWLLKALVFAIPLPYLANELGWTLAELGRQPWIVYGVMKTKDAVSSLATVQVLLSCAAFVLVYSLLGAADFYLLSKYARRGPESLAPQSAQAAAAGRN